MKVQTIDDLLDYIMGVGPKELQSNVAEHFAKNGDMATWIDSLPYQEDRDEWEHVAEKAWIWCMDEMRGA